MKKLIVIFMLTILLIGCGKKTPTEEQTLLVHCTMCMKLLYEELAPMYTEETGIQVNISSAPDGQMVTQLLVNPEGDVVQTGAAFFMEKIKDVVEDVRLVAERGPVIVASKGNPGAVHSLEDFSKEGVKVLMGDPDTSGIGKVTKALFDKVGVYEQVKPNVINYLKSSGMMMPIIKLGQADVCVSWRDITLQWMKKKGLEAEVIDIPKDLADSVKQVAQVAIIKNSKQKDAARKFVDWILSPDKKELFEAFGYPSFLPAEK